MALHSPDPHRWKLFVMQFHWPSDPVHDEPTDICCRRSRPLWFSLVGDVAKAVRTNIRIVNAVSQLVTWRR
jgi:hypothetical protein